MSTLFRTPEPHRLTVRWRRSLVVIAVTCGVGLAALDLFAPGGMAMVHAMSLVCAACSLLCLWLLADCVWPWVGGDRVDAEERAQADASLRRAYSWLFILALSGLVYLQAVAPADRLLITPDRIPVVLWSIIAVVVLLPLGLYAWADDGSRQRLDLGPLQLVRARFTGSSATLHWAALGSVAAAAPLLRFGTGGVGVGEGLLANGALLLALAGVVFSVTVAARAAYIDRRQGKNGRGH